MAENNGTPLPAGAPYNRGEQLKMWLGGEAELPPGAPYNRDEQLVMWLGDEAELPPGAPYNRDEQLTMWLKDHIGGVTPTGTINITENGTGIDVAQYATADVAVPSQNPNSKTDYNGTIADLNLPSGAVIDIRAGNATVYVEVDGTALGIGKETLPTIVSSEFQLRATASSISGSGVSKGAYLAWGSNGARLVSAYLYTPGTGAVDVSSYPLPTKTTVIYHPLTSTP